MSIAYRVVSQHGEAAHTRTKTFARYDDARAYGDTISPELDGTTVPNLDSPIVTAAQDRMEAEPGRPCYYQGITWHGNRYAVILEVVR